MKNNHTSLVQVFNLYDFDLIIYLTTLLIQASAGLED